MKKLFAVAAISLLPFGNAMADQDIGCGLGSMLLEGQKGKPMKILGATLNGTSGNQTFGITFGTLGCDGSGEITSTEKLAMYIDANMDTLARDMARGEGDSLATLSEVWGIQEADKAHFAAVVQSEFANVFTSTDVTSDEVLNNINGVIANDASLAGYVLS
ncbi:hypothetical protein C942_02391 [Photobacterium marinum]|uniref:Uncharacterized protein n=1 Tax=Photobacterium marinum TaxID=1056511 RepID=L8J8P7_9GAMM|nr:DUF3015 family protein [Photobacterium marinum]ELR64578.1 hypothetical protein C942_02391 [Photobacterium marinum]